jgi:hypothetical protein
MEGLTIHPPQHYDSRHGGAPILMLRYANRREARGSHGSCANRAKFVRVVGV